MPPVRRRPYALKVREVNSATDTRRQTLLTPSKGYRIRLVRVRVLQPGRQGRKLWELYFGSAPNIVHRPGEGHRHPGRPQRRLRLHPHLSEIRGAARACGTNP